MLRAVLVDDELHAREELEALLAETGEVTVVGTCPGAMQGLRTLRETRPDVLFLDISMPGVDGMQMLSMIEPELMPCVIFVTAYDEYALKAFDRNAIDYLLKPVEPARLAQALERAKRFLGEGRRPAPAGPPIDRIPCIAGPNIKLVDTAEVESVRSSEAGVYVVTPRGEFLTELTLTVLEAKGANLVRCHKQYLVNLACIDEIDRRDPAAAFIRTRTGRTVPVSRRFLAPLKERLGI
ncbi:two-component system response regulator BtsR [Geothrix sp. 21YS21S-2]|uniref:two-component system response regulator BtsR n=1 Tax=Geothrix sp. 21YS21S-2 TaxID=3068893 RepID=UPI0027B9BB95|nr:two-component system response regulator BtsR [Geothrix sp. 21YS21S-2]